MSPLRTAWSRTDFVRSLRRLRRLRVSAATVSQNNLRRIKNQTRTCPAEIFDNQSHGCPKRKRESGRKRGELQSGSAATPARPAPFADGRGKFKRRSDRFGKKTCACLGRPARSAGCPGAATAATGHRRRPTCIKTSTRLTLNCQI